MKLTKYNSRSLRISDTLTTIDSFDKGKPPIDDKFWKKKFVDRVRKIQSAKKKRIKQLQNKYSIDKQRQIRLIEDFTNLNEVFLLIF